MPQGSFESVPEISLPPRILCVYFAKGGRGGGGQREGRGATVHKMTDCISNTLNTRKDDI